MELIDFKKKKLENGIVCVEVSGRLDIHSLDLFKGLIEELSESKKIQVVFDFSGVSFIISTYLGLLVSFLKTCQRTNGRFTICSLQPQVQQTFRLMHLNELMEIYANSQEAIASFK